MANGNALAKAPVSIGDLAVDGLLRGVAAGAAMGAVIAAAGWFAGMPAAAVLSRFDPTGGGSALTGLLAHLATSGIYGLLFALATGPIAARLGSRLVLAGLVYGVLLLLVSHLLMTSELGAPLRALSPVGWALGHVLYGLLLGWLMVRR